MTDDRRLIEDYLPIQAISEEASREKSVRKGHISTLHLWWARRPLVACRAAVYGALVPASQFVPNGGTDAQKKSLGRANAAKFVKSLCQYPGSPGTTKEAQHHILKAHAERLTKELADGKATGIRPAWAQEFKFAAERVTVEDIQAGRAPRPRVLDMFAGGGAIPLEALRLGCEAYALDLNPVAHIIQLCTLVYPQKFGKPDSNVRGMTGPKNAKGEVTWGGLAEEVRYWGNWVLEKVRAEIGDLYPPIPDPDAEPTSVGASTFQEPQGVMGFAEDGQQRLRSKPGYLTPVAYLWTRTVKCKNPACGATVPLVRQTWMRKKAGNYVALRMAAPKGASRVLFEAVEAKSISSLGFDPDAFSRSGNAACPFCGTVADNGYVKAEGTAKRLGYQLMATACSREDRSGKTYVTGITEPDESRIRARIERLFQESGLAVPSEPMPKPGTLGFRVQPYGVMIWGELFTPRQMLCLLTFAAWVRNARKTMASIYDAEQAEAVGTLLAAIHDRLVDFSSTLCVWNCIEGERTAHTFGRHALPMTWDFSETAPFNEENAGWPVALERVIPAIASVDFDRPGKVVRGSATMMDWSDGTFDGVITDPPYYDNVPYADISDFFYVWLKRTLNGLHQEHLASETTPKKAEAVAEATRHGGSKEKARQVL